jgi:hypothetical protein
MTPESSSPIQGDIAAQFAWMGADAMVAVGVPFGSRRGDLPCGVWSLFEPEQEEGLLRRRLARLSQALRRIQSGPPCKGMLVVPTSGQPRVLESVDPSVVALCLPVPGIAAATEIGDAMQNAVLQLLGLDRKG